MEQGRFSASRARSPDVAVLLATYNGARFIEPQIRSLRENATRFTLHWLDDHSTDETREAARAAAREAGIELCAWHQPQRQGVPGTFFQLLECVAADIYLFCDQDDIWQPGKIDATVANLLPELAAPALCFSDPLMFYDEAPGVFQRVSEAMEIRPPASLQATRAFLSTPVAGQTVGLTRPLRDMYLRHKDIARAHAFMHSWWMYLLALATGTARMLTDVPTTLYRRHGYNQTAAYYRRRRRSLGDIFSMWSQQHPLRRGMSRQARGFILASATLPPGPKLERLLAMARLVETVDRQQSPAALVRLVRQRAMWPSWRRSLWLAAACLCTDARP